MIRRISLILRHFRNRRKCLAVVDALTTCHGLFLPLRYLPPGFQQSDTGVRWRAHHLYSYFESVRVLSAVRARNLQEPVSSTANVEYVRMSVSGSPHSRILSRSPQTRSQIMPEYAKRAANAPNQGKLCRPKAEEIQCHRRPIDETPQ